jgi:hypothetical protein
MVRERQGSEERRGRGQVRAAIRGGAGGGAGANGPGWAGLSPLLWACLAFRQPIEPVVFIAARVHREVDGGPSQSVPMDGGIYRRSCDVSDPKPGCPG